MRVWEWLGGVGKRRGKGLSGVATATPMGATSRKRLRNGTAQASSGKKSREITGRNGCIPKCFATSAHHPSLRRLEKDNPASLLRLLLRFVPRNYREEQ